MYEIRVFYEDDGYYIKSLTLNNYSEAVQTATDISKSSAVITDIIRDADRNCCWCSEDSSTLKRYIELDAEEYLNLPKGFNGSSDKPMVYFDMDGTLAL